MVETLERPNQALIEPLGVAPEALLPADSETLDDQEVKQRFAEIIKEIDADTSPEEEEKLDALPVCKTNGNAEDYSMWKA